MSVKKWIFSVILLAAGCGLAIALWGLQKPPDEAEPALKASRTAPVKATVARTEFIKSLFPDGKRHGVMASKNPFDTSFWSNDLMIINSNVRLFREHENGTQEDYLVDRHGNPLTYSRKGPGSNAEEKFYLDDERFSEVSKGCREFLEYTASHQYAFEWR